MALRIFAVVFGFAVASMIALALVTGFFVDWDWFESLGYVDIFWTVFGAKVALFNAIFATSAIAIWANGLIAYRVARRAAIVHSLSSPWDSLGGTSQRNIPWRGLIATVSVVLALLIASSEAANWDLALRFLYQAPYGQSDPLYGKDISFYLFSLPAYIALKDWILFTLVASVLCAGGLYWAHGAIVLHSQRRWISSAIIAHASVLLGTFLLVAAWAYWLDRFMLVYGDNGVVVGAGYTDIHVNLPILWGLVALCSAGAIAAFANAPAQTYRRFLVIAGLVFGSAFLLAPLFAAIFERVYVKPNELKFEAPYIARNIALTREAYRIKQIAVKPYLAEEALSFQSLQNNRATIDNIRLWDWQPLLDTYAQLQEIRTYYKFYDADIDRYQLGGSAQQVMLSPRELDSSLLPENAQTWVNLHVLFTHGSGVVMSPVTRITPEGLPILYLQNIPPVASGGPIVSEPRIYFGEAADSYVIVKGSTPEFDYPKGDMNVYSTYGGADGLAIGNVARRALFAWYFGDINILLSQYITGESRIMFRRNIQERVRTIAPFLRLDSDPYIVISGGRLFWIQDAYTISSWFPYAKPVDNNTNYIRNAVKVVIDAYNGTVSFYMSDPSDPIVQTYARIFPKLFKPLAAMAPDLRKHVRYPEDFFLIQAQLYRAYHMSAPEVFYNREDYWQFPRQPTGSDDSGDSKMTPYYINMRLPGETRTEFALMLPMVPSQRENMIAWLAARCDPPDYGKLIVYEFPKDKLIFGPFQIEALINQNTEISQQISLWNQMGSRIIRGNLLVVPIDNSILYVTPLYLRAQIGQLPELKRVIAVYGDHVVMEQTLGAALAALFKKPLATTPGQGTAPISAAPTADTAQTALAHYEHAIAKLKAGDWSGFGAELDALRPLLEQLTRQKQAGPTEQAGASATPPRK